MYLNLKPLTRFHIIALGRFVLLVLHWTRLAFVVAFRACLTSLWKCSFAVEFSLGRSAEDGRVGRCGARGSKCDNIGRDGSMFQFCRSNATQQELFLRLRCNRHCEINQVYHFVFPLSIVINKIPINTDI